MTTLANRLKGGTTFTTPDKANDLRGLTPESWDCIVCGVNTAPGFPNRIEAEKEMAIRGEVTMPVTNECEIYTVRDSVWEKAGLKPMSGCLCIGCLEKRIGRQLTPMDFDDHELNTVPATPRLLSRQQRRRKPKTKMMVRFRA